MTLSTGLRRGALAGLAGGVPFGMMMGVMGMLPTIGSMIGMESVAAGFAVHMMMSAGIGAGFGLLGAQFGPFPRSTSVGSGMLYGAGWWVLGPLTVMPLMMGDGLAAGWNVSAISGSLPSLMGHLVFGAVLGFVFHRQGSSGLNGKAR